jgi:hypothetical protein
MRKTFITLAAFLVAAPVMAAWPVNAQQTQMQAQQSQSPPPFDQSLDDQNAGQGAYLALGVAAIIGLNVFGIAESQHQTFVQGRAQVSP